MSRDRVIHLLSDEEISYILTGLNLVGRKYVEQGFEEDANSVNSLYSKVDKCLDMGVIDNDRI